MWQPNESGLAQIVSLLRDCGSTVDGVQARVHAQLQTFHAIPEYNNYLVFVFLKMPKELEYTRTVAGLILKTNITSYWGKMSKEVQLYIKTEAVLSLNDPLPSIRRTLSNVITTIVSQSKIQEWPELLPSLIRFLDSPDLNQIDGALSTIYLMCEDSASALDSEEAGRPLDLLVPKLICFFTSPHVNFRRHALGSLNRFIKDMPTALLSNMHHFLDGIFKLSSDDHPEVRKRVCQALVTLLDTRQDFIYPQIRNVIQYMLHSTQDPDENVALEACEFWSSLAETPFCKQELTEFLPQLLPTLLQGMQYSPADRKLLEDEAEEDEMQPDQEKDIKPRFHSSRVMGDGASTAPSTSTTHGAIHNNDQNEMNDDDDDSMGFDDDDDDDDEEQTQWNLRKGCAAGLDVLSSVFGGDMLGVLLPLIQDKIQEQQPWYVRESGILAIGAIAEGCIESMVVHLPKLIPYFLTLLNDSKLFVRSITCWTLGRYARWIVFQPLEKYFEPMLKLLLTHILARNKKVQKAAISAFATLEDEAGHEIIPYLPHVLHTLMQAYGKYQAKNLLILYDALGSLADCVGDQLNQPDLINILMPPLTNKWNSLADTDRNLLPLLECLTAIALALGPGFVNFAQPVFGRCVKLIESTLIALNVYRSASPEDQVKLDVPDKEFMVCAIDLIAGMTEGLGSSVESLVGQSNLPRLLGECMKEKGPDVRQCTFALVGDLAKSCIFHLRPYLHDFIPLLINSLVPDFISVCNNASWALGEIGVKVGEEMKAYVLPAVQRLIPIMNRVNMNRNLLENTAIALGRMGLVAPDVVAPALETFIKQWCLALRNIKDDTEKESAFKGMCMMINSNPQGAVSHLVYLCDAIASWRNPSPELSDMFTRILQMYKNGMGAQWAGYYGGFPEGLRNILSERYRL